MTIRELKKSILDKSYKEPFIIIKYSDYETIPLEYAKAIASNLGIEYKYIDNLNDSIDSPSLFGDLITDHILDILIVDNLDLSKYSLSVEDLKLIRFDKHPTIVICKKVITKNLDTKIIEMPKVEKWQVLDYMQHKCPKIDSRKLEWLYDIANGDLYRIDNELYKLRLFNEDEQDKMFDLINSENGYSDLTNMNIFNLSNGILANDKKSLIDVLSSIDSIDVNSYGLTTLLYNDIKTMIQLKTSKQATSESLGISYGKFNKIKNDLVKDNNRLYKINNLIKIFEFLSNYDYNLKSGNLMQDESRIIDYIICNVMTILNS